MLDLLLDRARSVCKHLRRQEHDISVKVVGLRRFDPLDDHAAEAVAEAGAQNERLEEELKRDGPLAVRIPTCQHSVRAALGRLVIDGPQLAVDLDQEVDASRHLLVVCRRVLDEGAPTALPQLLDGGEKLLLDSHRSPRVVRIEAGVGVADVVGQQGCVLHPHDLLRHCLLQRRLAQPRGRLNHAFRPPVGEGEVNGRAFDERPLAIARLQTPAPREPPRALTLADLREPVRAALRGTASLFDDGQIHVGTPSTSVPLSAAVRRATSARRRSFSSVRRVFSSMRWWSGSVMEASSNSASNSAIRTS